MGFLRALAAAAWISGQLHVVEARIVGVLNQRNEERDVGMIEGYFVTVRFTSSTMSLQPSEILPPTIKATNTELLTAPTTGLLSTPLPESIVAATSSSSSHTSYRPTQTSTPDNDIGPMSTSTAAGIGVGSTVGGIFVMIIVGFLLYRHKKRTPKDRDGQEGSKRSSRQGIEMRSESGPSPV
ncbi:uncharacterized protein BCR38DRAFT_482374 [Pseudomassariella vexata]|uniref:Mid2 domain-containing protein n=1 Tax=Pseudomassariella vexata TaxID=1141098 RepID=A0A1Y2EBG5_9PEZI|nr:uncharacterized protein BCR38DRAFT_482374 [Pseudomassariella vexata]ORY68901.1 hypothetical protein BCR38DRAFT_482374 [Pseudomassariella vexata]